MRFNTREKRGNRRKRNSGWRQRRRRGPEGSSEADKQNITARVTRKDPGKMRGLFPPLPPPLSPLLLTRCRSLALPPLPSISKKAEGREGEWTLLKHEWITKSRVHSFAPWRPRNPQKVYLFTTTVRRSLWSWVSTIAFTFPLLSHPSRDPPPCGSCSRAIRVNWAPRICPRRLMERK